MMKSKTRIPALILCFVLLLSFIPVTAASAATTRVSEVRVTGFRLPAVGQTVGDNLKTLSVPAGARYSIAETRWIDATANEVPSASTKFVAGHKYYLVMTFSPAYGCAFFGVAPTLNGSQQYLRPSSCEIKSDGTYLLFSSLLYPLTPVSMVHVNGFQTPALGQTAGDNLKTLSVPSGVHYTISEAKWIDDTSNAVMSSSSKFVAGHEYYLEVNLAPLSGYTIADADPLFNGTADFVDAEYTYPDGDSLIFYSINFSALQAIPTVNVTGFQKPAPGQTAGDNLKTLGIPSGAHYTIVDASWYDVTTDAFLSPASQFAAGHEYFLKVTVDPLSGYAFKNAELLFDGSAQYVDAEYTSMDGHSLVFYSIDMYAGKSGDIITVVDVNGFQSPVAGQTVGDNLKTIKVPSGAHYSIVKASWYDYTKGKYLDAAERFAAGSTYFLMLVFNADSGYSLSDSAEYLINGSRTYTDDEYCGKYETDFRIYSVDFSVSGSTAKKGDINGDGIVNAFDYQMVKAYVLGTFPGATAEMIAAMDVNGDSIVNAFDYQMIKAAVLGTYTFS